jgi:hypothetical protein
VFEKEHVVEGCGTIYLYFKSRQLHSLSYFAAELSANINHRLLGHSCYEWQQLLVDRPANIIDHYMIRAISESRATDIHSKSLAIRPHQPTSAAPECTSVVTRTEIPVAVHFPAIPNPSKHSTKYHEAHEG